MKPLLRLLVATILMAGMIAAAAPIAASPATAQNKQLGVVLASGGAPICTNPTGCQIIK
jgi:hypothetical protein